METVRRAFQGEQIALLDLELRAYPDEVIIVAKVTEPHYKRAIDLGNQLDRDLANSGFKGFIAVRAELSHGEAATGTLVQGVHDLRASQLATLLTARARTSEVQPSLSYLKDVDDNITRIMSQRHYLIFGRRGAGKTALMLEAKSRASQLGDYTIWINMQTHRGQPAEIAALWLYQAVCDEILGYFSQGRTSTAVLSLATDLRSRIDRLLASPASSGQIKSELPPRIRQLVKRFLELTQKRLFVFVDDLHYLSKNEQPQFLDLAHGAIRDSDAWLKVATIRHLSRWFIQHPPTGLQTGHDAAHIDLDLSLQEPQKAKNFLEEVLLSYAQHTGVNFLSSLFRSDALDRLILASGGVPRDYIELSSASIREAQKRDNAKQVGVQDVNRAAGNAATVKISEIEEDVAGGDDVPVITSSLGKVRKFCLDDLKFTFFRIEFRDREKHPREYSYVQSLLDLRLLHLINASVSDQHSAGTRSEVIMLDLSQFSGDRLKKDLTVLDLDDGTLVIKTTGSRSKQAKSSRSRQTKANTPRRLLELLRRGPVFELKDLALAIPKSKGVQLPKVTRRSQTE